jgi:hypothetical protein
LIKLRLSGAFSVRSAISAPAPLAGARYSMLALGWRHRAQRLLLIIGSISCCGDGGQLQVHNEDLLPTRVSRLRPLLKRVHTTATSYERVELL